MRLWSIHPKYLDAKGLVALWRESLLARAVLRGMTRGYRNHPQLERFRAHDSPRSAINVYLQVVHAEAQRRGYSFDERKIGPVRPVCPIPVTSGQLSHEWERLMDKLAARKPDLYRRWLSVDPEVHPIFMVSRGPIEQWERVDD